MRHIATLIFAALLLFGAAATAKAAVTPENPPTIFGQDDRQIISDPAQTPYSGIAKLYITYKNGTTGEGTGFIFGDNVVATAAHCLYDTRYGRGGEAASITIVPGLGGDGQALPGQTVTAAEKPYHYPLRWKTAADWRYDYGVITVPSKWDGRVERLALADWEALSDQSLCGETLSIAGYDDRSANLYLSSGPVRSARPFDLLYEIDILAGESGAPVLNASGQVVAIQNYGANVGASAQQNPFNSGARMTEKLYRFLASFIQ